MIAIFETLSMVLGFFTWIIIFSVIFSWLYAFNVINSSNQFVNQIGGFLYQITEPVYRPVRRFLPSLNGIDLSPLVILILIFFLQRLIATSIIPAL